MTASPTIVDRSYDLIVIGAGIGALAAAAVQARRGKRVLVLEEQAQVGGYATTFDRAGVCFDVSLHLIGGVKSTRLKGLLQQAGIDEKLVWRQPKELLHWRVRPNGPLMVIPNGDIAAVEQVFKQQFPQNTWAIGLWFQTMRRFGKQLAWWDKVRQGLAWQGLALLLMPVMAPLIVGSVFINQPLSWALRTRNPQLRRALLHFSGYYGTPASRINMLFPMVANYGYYQDGGSYLQGGGYAMVRALTEVILEHGGVIRTHQKVTRIQLEDQRSHGVKGVSVQQDSTFYECSQVVCGANPFVVYQDLLAGEPIAKRQLKRLQQQKISISASVLYLKINRPVASLNSELSGVYEYMEPSPVMDEEAEYAEVETRFDFSNGYENQPFTLTVHSVLCPELCAASGTGDVLNVFFLDNYDRWATLSPSEYEYQKFIETERMLDRIEPLLPDIRRCIEVMELGTPRTMTRFTGNPKGALYGFSQDKAQSGRKRMAIASPIPGLSFVSAWSQIGGGYEGSLRAADAYLNPVSWKGVAMAIAIAIALSIALTLLLKALL